MALCVVAAAQTNNVKSKANDPANNQPVYTKELATQQSSAGSCKVTIQSKTYKYKDFDDCKVFMKYLSSSPIINVSNLVAKTIHIVIKNKDP